MKKPGCSEEASVPEGDEDGGKQELQEEEHLLQGAIGWGLSHGVGARAPSGILGSLMDEPALGSDGDHQEPD